MLSLLQQDPLLGILAIVGIILSFTIHELGHAYAAYWSGDPTPKYDGKLNPNPIQHIDPLGLILVIMIGFGFAKPVITQPHRYKYPWSDFVVSAAGVFMNMVVAVLCIWLSNFTTHDTVNTFLWVMASINVSLAVFNSLPIPPLDGSHMLIALLPKSMQAHWRTSARGLNSIVFLLGALIANSLLGDPLGTLVDSILHTLVKLLLF